MCLLTYYPDGVMPDASMLQDAAEVNPDGHGFAIVTPSGLLIERGMDAVEMIHAFVEMRDVFPERPALFHSRWASHGSIGLDNCHPFEIGGDPRTVVAHNGVLPAWTHPSKGDARSDTRIAAEDCLPAFGSLDSEPVMRGLAGWMGPHNKIVILTVDPQYRHNAYLVNEDHGHWVDGVWYSNLNFLTPRQPWPTWSTSGSRCDNTGLTCPVCWCEDALDPDRGFCQVCGCCPDCTLSEADCLCYWPAGVSR